MPVQQQPMYMMQPGPNGQPMYVMAAQPGQFDQKQPGPQVTTIVVEGRHGAGTAAAAAGAGAAAGTAGGCCAGCCGALCCCCVVM